MISKVIMSWESSRLEEPFQSTCFGHVISKVCQCGTTNNKVCVGLHNIFVYLNKYLELHNMAKNVCERMSRLDETYIDVNLPPWKLNIFVETR